MIALLLLCQTFLNWRQAFDYIAAIGTFSLIIALMLLLKYLYCVKNENNANDNSSGVCLALHLYQEIPNIAVILFDNEEKGKFGSKAMKSTFQNDPLYINKLFINFDTVGCKDILLLSEDDEASFFKKKSVYLGKPILNGHKYNIHTDFTSLTVNRRIGISTNNGDPNDENTLNHGPIHSAGDTTIDIEMMTIVEAFVKDVVIDYE